MKRFISYFMFSCLAGFFSIQNISAQDTLRETATDPFGNTVIVERHKLTGVASRIWHSNPNFGMFVDSSQGLPRDIRGSEIDRQMVGKFAPEILGKYKTLLGIDPEEFTLERAEWDGEFWYVSFEQSYKGIPVHTGKFGFTLNRDGNIISIGSDGHPDLDLSVTPQRNLADLIEIAKSQFNAENADSLTLLSQPLLLIYPDQLEDEMKYHLAYKIELDDKISGDKRRYFIDANTAGILLERSMWREFGNWTVSGNVKGTHWPVNSGGSQEEAPARQATLVRIRNSLGQQIATGVTDANGNYSISGTNLEPILSVEVELKGSWARIQNPGNQVTSPAQAFPPSGNSILNFNFTDTNDGFHVYHHMNVIHDFIKGSPFNYNGMDWQMLAKINDNGVRNAAADGVKLRFSANDRNWWESSDVVYHEYTHNIVYSIYGNDIGSTGGAMGDAMDEGIADYFAATINEEPTIDYIGRTVSNPFTVNDDYNPSDPHFSGQILSGAMWDLESTTSQNTGRQLNFKAMQITPQPDTFVEFVNNVLLADDNNSKLCDGTPNDDAIIQAFETNHGISPTNLPALCPPTNLTITNAGNLGENPNLSWNASSGATSYNIYRCMTNSIQSCLYELIDSTTNTTYTDIMIVIRSGSQSNDTFHWQVSAVNSNGESARSNTASTVGEQQLFKQSSDSEVVPEKFTLHQNYPNPFNPSTEIRYELPDNSQVTLNIFNLVGQKVRTLVEETQSPGYYNILWDGKNDVGEQVTSGVYLYKIIATTENGGKQFISVKKMSFVQ